MRANTLFGLMLLSGSLAYATAAHAQYVLNVEQSGRNVVASGTGSINTAGLGSLGNFYSGYTAGFIQDVGSSIQGLYTGAVAAGKGYNGLIGPEFFLSDSGVTVFQTNIGSGGGVGILGGSFFSQYGPILLLEPNYASGSALNSTAAWDDETIALLGLIDGAYVWTWDGGNGSFTLDVGTSPIPEPGTLPLLATLVGLGALAHRTQRASWLVRE